MSQVLTCPMQFTSRITFLLCIASRHRSMRKHVTSANKCCRNRSLSLRVSVLFQLFITCAAGGTTLYCVVLFFHGRGNVLETGSVCNCTAGEKTAKNSGESQCVRGFESWSQRAYFGVPDESPTGCDCTLSACSTSSCSPPLHLSDGETPEVLKTPTLMVVC